MLEQQRLGTKGSRNTIFDTILDANLPPQEVTKERLLHESLSIVPAGLETTARALTVAIYHILSTPSIHSRLLKELEDAIPDSSTMPSWDELMRLPYLSACIDECSSSVMLHPIFTLDSQISQRFDSATA